MAWYDEAIFYHIYPLGLLGAPAQNEYNGVTHRLKNLDPWIEHIEKLGCNAIYIGPLFESVGHGYETTDYRKLDSRLGDNKDLKRFVKKCHDKNIRVILDGVFNHTGRDFFAFKDIKENRENSRYKDWYCNVNFWGNNEYNDGFSYDNWGGYNLLVKLNQRNPEVRDYLFETIRFWVSEFDIDGLRLDAADVLDFDFMKALRGLANEIKPDFWLMGEVIHGDYTRWVNEGTLHSVTNYVMHKAFYSGHNDHNYFEIAHTQRRLEGMGGSGQGGFKLYNFVDNHDVERISTKLNNKAHYAPVHILLYTLPGIPSVYYGSEFAIEGRKEKFSDASLRPALDINDFKDALETNPATKLIAALGKIRKNTPELSYGDYKELHLTNRQFAFSRSYEGKTVVVAVNNDDGDCGFTLPAGNAAEYIGLLSGEKIAVNNGNISFTLHGNSGEIYAPFDANARQFTEEKEKVLKKTSKENEAKKKSEKKVEEKNPEFIEEITEGISASQNDIVDEKVAGETDKTTTEIAKKDPIKIPESTNNKAKEEVQEDSKGTYEDGVIAGLQQAVIALMEKNGYVTDQMRQDVYNNVYHDSLITWIKSFR
ncbi:alpha-amylase family glycosyl hydrolase [Butyrivibrio sp. YAB3001]|uniref:alpha-amylase family glycosyl hydrolase n=1 Tax=Butyrivibrio sp. YAB3001 TaxID=1520812 RepID=UPI0008F633CD|nr:alpha-amylase family glycosyl hydrolase [Butyrivibrio sp. YAB3001]SFB69699.1 Glycosidase [Butyrivibrio sp. YAB3001]